MGCLFCHFWRRVLWKDTPVPPHDCLYHRDARKDAV